MRILFADTAHPFLKESLEKAGHSCYYSEELNRSKALEILPEFDGAVIRSRFKFDAEMLNACSKLKFIVRVGAGMENIDVPYAESKGICCLNAPEGNRNAVAEQALGMLLNMMNNIQRADDEVRKGIWIREGNRGYELDGRTVGIIGFGNTGKAFAQKLKGFNVRILAFDPFVSSCDNQQVELVDMKEIFEHCDVVSLHIPLTDETRNLVNQAWLNKFQKPIWLLNTARGKCLNTSDLLDAIDAGKVIGAGLDVLEFESLSFEHMETAPEVVQRLMAEPRVLLTPHIAGWTHESNRKMAEVLLRKILEVIG
jgi:D-3-phosphoglycerate dehydrogenase / 2-oxoglutarate reductase